MKKVLYAILICIIIAGIVVIATIGLKSDIIYSRNVQMNIYIGQTINKKDIEDIVKEVFPNERVIVQEVEVFQDMVAITLLDTRSDEDLNAKVEELNTKINEKYQIENKTEDINITHNPRVRLSSILIPYLLPIGISFAVILILVGIRYRKLGIVKILINYILSVGIVELTLLSIIAIARIPINRLVIPIGLILFVITLVVLGYSNEKKLSKSQAEEK